MTQVVKIVYIALIVFSHHKAQHQAGCVDLQNTFQAKVDILA